MEPTNPRWDRSGTRTTRRATIWKIVVGAAGASALTAVVVASCLDRGEAARGDLPEPAYVETTSATRDSTGGITPRGPVKGAPDDMAGTTSSTTTITSAPMSTQAQPRERNYTPVPVPFERANGDSSTSGTAGTTDVGNVHRDPNGSVINPLTSGGPDLTSILSDAGPNAGHASHANNDPNNRDANAESPPMTPSY